MNKVFLPLVLLLFCTSARAQWSGNVDLLGGYGGLVSVDTKTPLRHVLGSGSAGIGYKQPGFQWKATVRASYENITSETYRLSATASETPETGVRISSDYKSKSLLPWTVSFRSDAIWTPGPSVRRNAWVLYSYKGENGENYTTKDAGVNGVGDLAGVYFDIPVSKTHQTEAGYAFTRPWPALRRILGGNVSLQYQNQKKLTQWLVYEDYAASPDIKKIYAISPESARTDLKGEVHLKDSVFTFGVRLAGSFTSDHNMGATLESEDPVVWRDSTRLKEDFSFLTLTAEPFFAASYKWKDLSLKADYGFQLYGRRLSDDMHPTRKLDLVRPALVGSSRVDWAIPGGHTLSLGNTASVKHPDYLQICWYDRQGAYLNQVYRGSTTLLSTVTYAFNLGYKYKYKRFSAQLTAAASRRIGEVDQTYFDQDVDGVTYQVFTWVNASDSWTFSLSPRLGWSGKWLRCNLGVDVNRTLRTSRSDGTVKPTQDWGVWSDMAISPGRGWLMVADVRYRSSVSSFFTSFSEYWTLNVKIQKSFGSFVVYLQGRDLLDSPVSREFLSADGLQWWTEELRENRRLIVLGGGWKF